jgi:hypothetical protein
MTDTSPEPEASEPEVEEQSIPGLSPSGEAQDHLTQGAIQAEHEQETLPEDPGTEAPPEPEEPPTEPPPDPPVDPDAPDQGLPEE